MSGAPFSKQAAVRRDVERLFKSIEQRDEHAGRAIVVGDFLADDPGSALCCLDQIAGERVCW